MIYRLNITEHAESLLDNLLCHLLFHLKNEQAARHLMDKIKNVYDRLEDNPFQFPLCQSVIWAEGELREAIVPEMDYVIIFNVAAEAVNILGIFHQLENYHNILKLRYIKSDEFFSI